MQVIVWLIEQSIAAAVGYYVAKAIHSREAVQARAIAAQTKAARAAENARALTEAAQAGDRNELE